MRPTVTAFQPVRSIPSIPQYPLPSDSNPPLHFGQGSRQGRSVTQGRMKAVLLALTGLLCGLSGLSLADNKPASPLPAAQKKETSAQTPPLSDQVRQILETAQSKSPQGLQQFEAHLDTLTKTRSWVPLLQPSEEKARKETLDALLAVCKRPEAETDPSLKPALNQASQAAERMLWTFATDNAFTFDESLKTPFDTLINTRGEAMKRLIEGKGKQFSLTPAQVKQIRTLRSESGAALVAHLPLPLQIKMVRDELDGDLSKIKALTLEPGWDCDRLLNTPQVIGLIPAKNLPAVLKELSDDYRQLIGETLKLFHRTSHETNPWDIGFVTRGLLTDKVKAAVPEKFFNPDWYPDLEACLKRVKNDNTFLSMFRESMLFAISDFSILEQRRDSGIQKPRLYSLLADWYQPTNDEKAKSQWEESNRALLHVLAQEAIINHRLTVGEGAYKPEDARLNPALLAPLDVRLRKLLAPPSGAQVTPAESQLGELAVKTSLLLTNDSYRLADYVPLWSKRQMERIEKAPAEDWPHNLVWFRSLYSESTRINGAGNPAQIEVATVTKPLLRKALKLSAEKLLSGKAEDIQLGFRILNETLQTHSWHKTMWSNDAEVTGYFRPVVDKILQMPVTEQLELLNYGPFLRDTLKLELPQYTREFRAQQTQHLLNRMKALETEARKALSAGDLTQVFTGYNAYLKESERHFNLMEKHHVPDEERKAAAEQIMPHIPAFVHAVLDGCEKLPTKLQQANPQQNARSNLPWQLQSLTKHQIVQERPELIDAIIREFSERLSPPEVEIPRLRQTLQSFVGAYQGPLENNKQVDFNWSRAMGLRWVERNPAHLQRLIENVKTDLDSTNPTKQTQALEDLDRLSALNQRFNPYSLFPFDANKFNMTLTQETLMPEARFEKIKTQLEALDKSIQGILIEKISSLQASRGGPENGWRMKADVYQSWETLLLKLTAHNNKISGPTLEMLKKTLSQPKKNDALTRGLLYKTMAQFALMHHANDKQAIVTTANFLLDRLVEEPDPVACQGLGEALGTLRNFELKTKTAHITGPRQADPLEKAFKSWEINLQKPWLLEEFNPDHFTHGQLTEQMPVQAVTQQLLRSALGNEKLIDMMSKFISPEVLKEKRAYYKPEVRVVANRLRANHLMAAVGVGISNAHTISNFGSLEKISDGSLKSLPGRVHYLCLTQSTEAMIKTLEGETTRFENHPFAGHLAASLMRLYAVHPDYREPAAYDKKLAQLFQRFLGDVPSDQAQAKTPLPLFEQVKSGLQFSHLLRLQNLPNLSDTAKDEIRHAYNKLAGPEGITEDEIRKLRTFDSTLYHKEVTQPLENMQVEFARGLMDSLAWEDKTLRNKAVQLLEGQVKLPDRLGIVKRDELGKILYPRE